MRYMELKKAMRRANVWIAMGLGILLSILHAVWVSNMLEVSFFQRIRENGKNAYFLATPSFMQGWIGMDVFSVYGSLFYLVLFPMLAAMPYAASQLRERQLGYDKQEIIRSGRKKYYFAKYISVFLTSGIVVTIPSVISWAMWLLCRFCAVWLSPSGHRFWECCGVHQRHL